MIKERLLMIRESRLCWHLILGVGYVGKSEHLAADYLQPSASLARCTMHGRVEKRFYRDSPAHCTMYG